MPTPLKRFGDLASLKSIASGLKSKYEPKDANIVKDANYVHTDECFTTTDKQKLDGITAMTNAELDAICV